MINTLAETQEHMDFLDYRTRVKKIALLTNACDVLDCMRQLKTGTGTIRDINLFYPRHHGAKNALKFLVECGVIQVDKIERGATWSARIYSLDKSKVYELAMPICDELDDLIDLHEERAYSKKEVV